MAEGAAEAGCRGIVEDGTHETGDGAAALPGVTRVGGGREVRRIRHVRHGG